ncbi:pirin family protein [Paenibacillus durus]|nr:pirin family protein [Paenibacillus durus]
MRGRAIDLNPHKGCEIMTYFINGRAEHGDFLGTKSPSP